MIGKWGRPLVRLMAMKGWQAVMALCWWECCSHTRHRRHRGISVLVTLCEAKGEHTQCTGKGPSAVVRATILPLLSINQFIDWSTYSLTSLFVSDSLTT